MNPRKICVVTGTRADYGLLYWIMRGVQNTSDLQLQLVATGMHLSHEFGLTYREIEDDGFQIDERVEMLLSGDSPTSVAKSMGLGTIGCADAFRRLEPDVLLVLGDRFEALSAAQAALMARIPIAHVHGGEVTEGAVDDAIRHSITKMAHWHFVAARPFQRRIIQLGEAPDRVLFVGAPGLDYLRNLERLDRPALEESLSCSLDSPTFLVTYHPATLGDMAPADALKQLLKALDAFPEVQVIFTKANADAEGRQINQMIEKYAARNSSRVKAFTSLGQQRYLSLLHEVDVVLGNSSSGIIEAPAIPVGTVNIGDRQKGRPRASSVIDCPENSAAIISAIERALSSAFRKQVERTDSRYGEGGASTEIVKTLRRVELPAPRKSFHDFQSEVVL